MGESEGDMGVMDDIGNQILHAFLWRLSCGGIGVRMEVELSNYQHGYA